MPEQVEKISYCKIHPAIGVARVGNSPDEFFVGPEVPGVYDPPSGGYKDAGDLNKGIPPRVKRQAARFRIFGYDEDHNVVREITAAEAEISWTVHLANKKAEWDRFAGRAGEKLPIGDRRDPPDRRNPDIRDEDPEEDSKKRQVLVIDPGPRSLDGPGQSAEFPAGELDAEKGAHLGAFFDIPVPLGEIRTDSAGRLLVLGGFGKSGTSEPGRRITNYANNDRWYDDVSDGPVTATVRMRDGKEIEEVKPSWVVVGPPDFAPGVPNVVTMYDVVYETTVGNGEAASPERLSFTEHVYPILLRPYLNIWVHAEAASHPQGHGTHGNLGGDFFEYWDQLKSKLPADKPVRQEVFGFLRNPYAKGKKAKAQANRSFMPPLSGDDGEATHGQPGTWLKLTKTQYEIMRRWAEGDFEADWPGSLSPGFLPTPPDDDITPEGLDRAALEACAGGGFYPGIEGGWMFRNHDYYSEPFRLDHGRLKPGDATKRMAVPWQADFFECRDNWWPAQRPDAVLTYKSYKHIRDLDRQIENLTEPGPDKEITSADEELKKILKAERDKLAQQRTLWTRVIKAPDGSPAVSPEGDNQMVHKWYRLGFLASQGEDGKPLELEKRPAFVETETGKYEGRTMAEYFHLLVNIEDHPDFLPTARELALDFFAQANYAADPNYARFEYTPEAFDRRMEKIYDDLVAKMHDLDWLDPEIDPDARPGSIRFSDKAVIENLRQKAPMNLVDGAWLQNVQNAGPADDVRSKLFEIWADEAGNGKTEQNHSNVYDALLRSINVYLPPITSEDFMKLDLLPSAWSNPVFQLSVGQFPQEFFPELLGMTLYLEWEATPTLTPIVKMLEKRQINPHFYQLHVAIDNVASGHGAMAKKAIKLYLDEIRESGGDRMVQDHWRRIWNGYVTWATEGTFASDLLCYLIGFDGQEVSKEILKEACSDETEKSEQKRKYARIRMEEMIRRKAPYARKSHGTIKLGRGDGRKYLNALFEDPPALMKALLEDPEKWIDLDNPRDSRFFSELLDFRGPMYKVFTPEDQDIILDWLESLRSSAPPPTLPDDPGQKMKALIERRTDKAREEPLHREHSMTDDSGVTKNVQDWFKQEAPEAVMKALAEDSNYIVKGKVEDSKFFTEVLSELMPGVFQRHEREVMEDWVRKGCPMPGEVPSLAHVAAIKAAAARGEADAVASEKEIPFATRRRLIGAGCVH